MKYIFGSGLIGLFAKHLLPGEWEIVPFRRSRFFSWSPPLDDDFIIHDPRMDDLIQQMFPGTQTIFRKRGISYHGEIFSGDKITAELRDMWIYRLFGYDPPGPIVPYLKSHMGFATYRLSLNSVYNSLMKKFSRQIEEGKSKGDVTEVGDHYFIRGGKRYDFEAVVSTIPHNALLNYAKIPHDLKTATVQVVQVASQELNFEGHDQLLVTDPEIGFYKVDHRDDGSYIFYFKPEMAYPAKYLMSVLKRFEIRNGTSIPDYITLGSADLNVVKRMGFIPIGSYAEWDWCGDVGTNLLRLLSLEKYSKPISVA